MSALPKSRKPRSLEQLANYVEQHEGVLHGWMNLPDVTGSSETGLVRLEGIFVPAENPENGIEFEPFACGEEPVRYPITEEMVARGWIDKIMSRRESLA